MSASFLLLTLVLLAVHGYFLGHYRAKRLSKGSPRKLSARPGHYGSLTALAILLPAFIAFGLWNSLESRVIDQLVLNASPAALLEQNTGLLLNQVKQTIGADAQDPQVAQLAQYYQTLSSNALQIRYVLVLAIAIIAGILVYRRIHPNFHARQKTESVVLGLLLLCASIAILTTVGIVFSVLFESLRFFGEVSITEFLFGTNWSPQIAMRTDQAGASGAFGVIPLLVGTLLISLIALSVAVPLGLFSAIYLAEYANKRVRAIAKPLLEVLAGIPTVVYGFFAALTVAPALRGLGAYVGLDVASESALAAGLVMGLMIVPFVSSLSEDVLTAVPQSLRDGSLGLGATHSETIRKVIIPAALPGIVGSILLAASRAIGETMIVVMAAGLSANLTVNPLSAVTTVTVQIVTLLTGDQEFDSAKTLAAFALGLVLFLITLSLNLFALHVVRKYREQYE